MSFQIKPSVPEAGRQPRCQMVQTMPKQLTYPNLTLHARNFTTDALYNSFVGFDFQ